MRDPALMHGKEFRRCLLELDVDGMRRLWALTAGHLPQPQSAEEALYTMHLARVQMKNISHRARLYSQAWLKEREKKSVVAPAVGTAVGGLPGSKRTQRHVDLAGELQHVVLQSVRAGIDVEADAKEVKIRIDDRIAKFKGRYLGR